MKYNEFTFQDGKMLMWRLGNMNSNKQKHWHTPETRQPPAKRGIWCFPYPHYDFFFCYHQWEARLPKKYRKEAGIGIAYPGVPFDYEHMTDEECAAYWEERERLIKKIRKEFPPTKFWYAGEFYSHIPPKGNSTDEWYWWDNVREWAKVAQKHLYLTDNTNGVFRTFKYSVDHLEIFIPNY
jgi:hypothetical protein